MFDAIINYMDKVTIIVSFVTLFFVIKDWRSNKKQLEKISIYFNNKKLNLDITRKDITRAELQGILGIFRKNMKVNYHIEYLSQIKYLDTIYKIQTTKLNELHIEITDKELEQFKDDIYETNI